MKRVIILVVVCLSCVYGHAQSPEYASRLKTMLRLSGGEQTFQAAIDQMMSMVKQNNASVPEEIWAEMETEFKKTSIDDLVTKLVPIYSQHLTLEDLNGLIEFYKTPVGKKFAEKTPLITQQSIQVGQQWGMEVGQKIVNKIKEEGY